MRIVTNLIILTIVLACPTPAVTAEVTIQAEKAAIRTEGGPLPGGCWNLWSNGRVGQSLRVHGSWQLRHRGPGLGQPRRWCLAGDGPPGRWPGGQDGYRGRCPTGELPLRCGTGRGDSRDRCGVSQRRRYRQGRSQPLSRTLHDHPAARRRRNRSWLAKQELAEAAEKRERQIVAATQAAIEKHRKADAKIRVVDAAGRPVPGVKVTVEQTAHEFLFGCNIYGFDRSTSEAQNAAYKRRFAELFNYATVGFYWRWYETAAWQAELRVHRQGRRVVPGARDSHEGAPAAVGRRGRSPALVPRPAVAGDPAATGRGRSSTATSGKIDFWEVVNEPSHLAEPKIDQPYRWARQADPAPT